MQLSELTVTLKGPILRIRNFEIEGIDLLDKVEDDPSGDSSSVSVKGQRNYQLQSKDSPN
jgi:hypothetical protein